MTRRGLWPAAASWVIAALVAAAPVGCAGVVAAPRTASDELRELARFVETAHPRPFAYTTRDAWSATIAP